MALDAVFNGAPSNVPAPSGQPALGLDQVSGALYFSGKGATGWTAVPNAGTNASSIDGVTVTGTPSTGQAIVATGASTAHWAAPPTTGFSGSFVLASLGIAPGSVTVLNGVITAVTPAT